MKGIQKLMIVILIVIVVLVIAILLLLNMTTENEITEEPDIHLTIDTDYIAMVQDYNIFREVENCVENYINFSVDKNEEALEALTDEENTKQIQLEYSNYKTFQAKRMYQRENNDTVNTFFVYGMLNDEKTIRDKYEEGRYNIEELYIIVHLDMRNKTFLIIPNAKDYFSINEDGSLSINENMNLTREEIEKNAYNTYVSNNETEQDKVYRYFQDYINNFLYNLQLAYDYIDDEYKEQRFPSLELYKQYRDNDNFVDKRAIQNYRIDTNGDNVKYICEDQYGNIYSFEEIAIMQYKIQLDEYTLGSQKWTEEYANLESLNKAIVDIEKFFEMINMQDYTSAYEVLDATFKQNYFSTQQQFEEYIRGEFFRYNNVTYNSYTEPVTNLYSFSLTISDKAEEKQETIDFNVIMQLLDGTDFVMSFEVE